MSTASLSPALTIVNGIPVVSSLDIAKSFGRPHADLMRSVKTAVRHVSESFSQRNFALAEYADAQDKPRPYFILTRDGFSFVVMGFTGPKAAKWKEAYIEAFNAMESELMGRNLPICGDDAEPQSIPPRLTTAAERNGLAVMVNQIMGAQGPTTPGYQKFWRTLDAALGINHIDELTIDRLEPTVNLVKMLLDFATGRQNAIASRPNPLTVLEPLSDSIKDRIDAIGEALTRADKAYSDFLYDLRREVQSVIRVLVAEVNDGPAPAMERHAIKELTDELARTFADQSHSHMCAGNALRPTLRSLIHVASVCRHRVSHVKALPTGKPRGRKATRVALPA